MAPEPEAVLPAWGMASPVEEEDLRVPFPPAASPGPLWNFMSLVHSTDLAVVGRCPSRDHAHIADSRSTFPLLVFFCFFFQHLAQCRISGCISSQVSIYQSACFYVWIFSVELLEGAP